MKKKQLQNSFTASSLHIVMFHFIVPLIIPALMFTRAESESPLGPSEITNCEVEPASSMIAYRGWPVFPSCKDLYNRKSAKDETFYPGKNATCIIRAVPSWKIISNVTIQLGKAILFNLVNLEESAPQLNVTEELPSTYVLQLMIGETCTYQMIELNKSFIPSGCDGIRTYEYPAALNKQAAMECEVPTFLKRVENDLNWRWAYNCNGTLPSNIRNPDRTILVKETGFENAGNYVCFVQYDGKEMAVTVFDFCVKYPSEVNPEITMQCPDQVWAPIGGDTKLECISDVAVGKAPVKYIGGTWYRESNPGEELCDSIEGHISNSSIETEGNRIQCTMKSSIEEVKCHKFPPTEGQQQDKYIISLTIKNLKPSDFGGYIINHTNLGDYAINRTITLIIDDTADKSRHIAAFTSMAVLLVVIMLVISICTCKKKDIRWYWKKHFGPYEKEFFTYTAYFAYYYDFGRGEETMKKTKSLVENLHTFMDKFGGTVYDDARDHNVHQFDVDNILQVQSDCHRIIIVVTPEFLTDEWSRFKAYSALNEVIESGRKAIFISVPETKNALKDLEKSSRNNLMSAMKRNVTVKWDGNIPFSGKFKRRLEYALPKLRKPEYGRFLSESSQAQLTQVNRYAPKSDTSSNGDYSNGFSSVV